MEYVTLMHLLVCFAHLIWYFTGLLTELSWLVLSASISRLAGVGLPTRLFASVFLMGAILMILFPFQPQYESSHEYYENVNAYLYKTLNLHLYRQNRPPIIGDNYSREIGRKNVEKDLATLRIIFYEPVTKNDEKISTIIELTSDNKISEKFPNVRLNEIEVSRTIQGTESGKVEISKDFNMMNPDLSANQQITGIQSLDLFNVNSISNNEIVREDSTSSNGVDSIDRDTIERIESVVSIIEPDLLSEDFDDEYSNVNSREHMKNLKRFDQKSM